MSYQIHRRTLQLQGRARRFLLFVPAELAEGPNLLLCFHGSLQSPNVMRRFTNRSFEEVARRTGTILAYPEGVEHHFNDARRTLPVAARELGIDDVAFSLAIAEQVAAEFGTRRTFACGYSNGGQMVIRLLFDAPGLLAGACVFASTLGAGANHAPSNPDSAFRPTPAIFFHGTADPIAPYGGGEAGNATTRSRGQVRSAPSSAQRFADLNGAAAPAALTRPYPDAEVRRWEGTAPTELWTMEGVGHVIPCGNELDPRLGPNTDSFLAAEEMARFFGLRDLSET